MKKYAYVLISHPGVAHTDTIKTIGVFGTRADAIHAAYKKLDELKEWSLSSGHDRNEITLSRYGLLYRCGDFVEQFAIVDISADDVMKAVK